MTRKTQEIAHVLGQPARAGLFSIPHSETAAFAHVAPAMQLRLVELDLGDCTDKPALLQCIARAYQFPEWFGHNWDALADALGDLSWLPADGYLTLVRGIDALPPEIDRDTTTLLEILHETASDWTADGIPFWILIEDGAPRIAPLPIFD